MNKEISFFLNKGKRGQGYKLHDSFTEKINKNQYSKYSRGQMYG